MIRERVRISEVLRESMEADGFSARDIAEFVETFADWKAEGPEGEFAYFWFGKDGGYRRPQRNGRMVLWHVHLPPESDKDKVDEWDRLWGRKSRKSSDTALIYTHDSNHGYLLLYIVREPHGHTACDMSVPSAAKFMNTLADAAEAFIHSGAIVL